METRSAVELLAPPREAICLIGYNDLPSVWDELAPLVERACEHSWGDFTPHGVVDAMRDGRLQMLALVEDDAPSAVMLVSIERVDAGLILFVNLVGGRDMDGWHKHLPVLKQYAKQNGCNSVRAVGRRGLTKKLPDWRLIGVVLEMAV